MVFVTRHSARNELFWNHKAIMKFGRSNFRPAIMNFIFRTLSKFFRPLNCTSSLRGFFYCCRSTMRRVKRLNFFPFIDEGGSHWRRVGSWWFKDNSIKIECSADDAPSSPQTIFSLLKNSFSFLLWYQFVDTAGSRSCIIKTSICNMGTWPTNAVLSCLSKQKTLQQIPAL